jgi:DnaJ-class molecular chaperone
MKFQDYYEILGVKRDASTDDIKKAYRKLAMKWHPDRHEPATRADAEARFKQINEAKEVLTDPEKRAKYDRFGQNWQHGQDFNPGGNWRSANPEDFSQFFGGGGGFSDFFANIFGEDVQRRTRAPRRTRGRDSQAELQLPVSEAMGGGTREFNIGFEQRCDTCQGTGTLDGEHFCFACGGVGRTRGQRTVELRIPDEIRDGLVLRLRGMGEAGNGGDAGDLYLTLRLHEDDAWRIRGLDLYADVPVAPWEAVDGARVDLRTFDGTVTLTVPPGTQSGAKLRLRGLGLRNEEGTRGDLYAVIRMAMPENASEQQRELARQMKSSGPGTVKGGARA